MIRLAVLACLLVAQVQPAAPAADDFVQWAEPPGAATPADVALLERARAALDAGQTVSDVLIDPGFAPLHARTEFRELIAAHASAGPLTIAAPDEPGTRLVLTLEFRDESGAPVRDGLVYLYHTSAKGWYAAAGAHVRADSGDFRHARLFGYGRTDERGRLELRTIRPSGYPRSELPAHIHLHLSVGGQAVPGVGEIHFDDDARLTPAMREHSAAEHNVIVKTEAQADGSLRGEALFTVRLPVPSLQDTGAAKPPAR